jgi:hypothetical protein
VYDPACLYLYVLFDPGTPVVLVGYSGDAGRRKNELKNIFRTPNWVKMCPPLRDGHGCMYMKYTYVAV